MQIENILKKHIENGYNLTQIAKKMKKKNKTLKKICLENNIDFPQKGKRKSIKQLVSGKIKTRYGIFMFFSNTELFFINRWNKDNSIEKIRYIFDSFNKNSRIFEIFYYDGGKLLISFSRNAIDHFKHENFNKKNIPGALDIIDDFEKTITIKNINNLVLNKNIIFNSNYYNKRFGISYEW